MAKCNGCQYLGCMEMPNSWLYRCINTKDNQAKNIVHVPRKTNLKKFEVNKPDWCEKEREGQWIKQ